MARLKRYTLQDLMDECDPSVPRSAEEQAWLDMVPVGLEAGELGPVPQDLAKPSEASNGGAGSNG